MSIEEIVQKKVDDKKLLELQSLDFVLWGIPQEDTARTMRVTPDMFAEVTPPFADTEEGYRIGELRGWLDGFIEGCEIFVAEDPDRKPPDAMLARVHPVKAEFWSIRVTHPEEAPGIRAFGAFSEKDKFIALTWEFREVIADQFNEEVASAIAVWKDHFGVEEPYRGDHINAYLTTCCAV